MDGWKTYATQLAVGLPANWCVLANKDPRCIQGFLQRPVLKLQSPSDFATLWIATVLLLHGNVA